MGSRKTPQSRGCEHAVTQLLSPETIGPIVQNVLSAQHFVVKEYIQILCSSLDRFLRNVLEDMPGLKTPRKINEYVEACKNRAEDLENLRSFLLENWSKGTSLRLYRQKTNGEQRPYKGKYESGVLVVDTTEEETNWYTVSRNPKAYSPLFEGIYNLIDISGELSQVPDEVLLEDIQKAILTISSFGRIYEDFRGTEDFIRYEEDVAYSRLQGSHQLDEDSEFWSTFQEMKTEFTDGLSGKPVRPYLKDMVDAVRRELPLRNYERSDAHLSMKSTGTKYKGRGLPGLFASIVEIDPLPEFDVPGYDFAYRTENVPETDQTAFKTITIEQHKVSRRTIHMASNAIQDKMNYIHNIVQTVLNRIPSDCTIDQRRGVTFALQVTSLRHRERAKNNVYSIDISKATDTENLRYSVECLRLIIGDLADNWECVMTHPKKFFFQSRLVKEYQQLMGQAQGYKSSFPVFSWTHHLLVRAVMLATGRAMEKPSSFYRVLGDDIIISCRDTDLLVNQKYREFCLAINWETNDKGYEYYHNRSEFAIAEFAKIKIRDGQVATPIPIRLMLKASNIHGWTQLYCWLSENYCKRTLSQYLGKVERLFPTAYAPEHYAALREYRQLGLVPMLNAFSFNESIEINYARQVDLAVAYFSSELLHTLIGEFMPEWIRGTERMYQWKVSIDQRIEDELLEHIRDLEGHKYHYVLERNRSMIERIDAVFGGQMPAEALMAHDLSQEEEQKICTLCDILMLEKDDWYLPSLNFYELIAEVTKIIERFRPVSNSVAKAEDALVALKALQFLERQDFLASAAA